MAFGPEGGPRPKRLHPRTPSSSQSPLGFVSACGENCTRSLAPPLPTKPASLGFCGGPMTGASAEVQRQLSGVLDTTVRQSLRQAMPFCGQSDGRLKHPVGRLPG